MDGQMPFEEWIYGTPPQDVNFVRINGNRVIRVEIAKEGKPIEIFTEDVVSPMMVANGTPELAQSNVRIIKEGDVERDPNKEAPAPPPSLRMPGETLPTEDQSTGVMRPVQMPKPHPDEMPGANPDEQSSAPPASAQPSQKSNGQPSSPSGAAQPSPRNSQPPPTSGSQPQSAPANTAPAANGSQQPQASTSQFVPPGAATQQN
jgi:hypothetical protein